MLLNYPFDTIVSIKDLWDVVLQGLDTFNNIGKHEYLLLHVSIGQE